MKIALICPTNMLYMPYVNNYIKILRETNIDYIIIYWDRFHIEENNNDEFKYRDKKVGFQRNFLDYFKYNNFIIKQLNKTKYDRIIVFTLQVAYFLKNYLIKNYKENYILDIRDHNKIIKFFNVKKVVNNSEFTVLSSPGYKEWLPTSDKYIINHNTQIDNMRKLKTVNMNFENQKIKIAYIGAIRDYQVNIDLINSVKNSENIKLMFHGEGHINKDITNYLENGDIRNIVLTGRYNKENEESLYNNSELINVLRYNDGVNNKTALPNRLYNALLYGKPLISFEGTYLSELIKTYNSGLVLDSFDNTEERIRNYYLRDFDKEKYEEGRISFLKKVINDNTCFKLNVKKFLNSTL
jgi:hypothetical protein